MLYEDGKPVAVDTIVISTQHDEDVELAKIRKDLIEYVIKAVVPAELLTDATKIFINRRASSSSAARRAIRA